MRIAISGSHVTGKSTLIEALSESLPQYRTLAEPYYLLQEEGAAFADPPAIEDFELQLERSLENMDERAPNVIFDRCPADILGYLLVHADADAFDLDAWLPRIRTAMGSLDLVVFVPVETPDRMVLPLSEDAAYRRRVDEMLKKIILEDSFGFGTDVLEVAGDLPSRVDQVISYIRRQPSPAEAPGPGLP